MAMDEGDDRTDSEDIKLKRWRESTYALLGAVDEEFLQPFTISVVPEELRKWNESAYMPKVVSIGPRYKGTKRGLVPMEEIKLRCMLTLFDRLQEPGEVMDNNNLSNALNAYSATPYATQIPIILWHYWTRIPEYVCNFLKILSRGYILFASVISLLTIVQTVYATLSYHYPKQ